jgi:hypothetical protein
MWFNPDIKAADRIKLQDGSCWEIISDPENIEMRNMYLKFKVQRQNGEA